MERQSRLRVIPTSDPVWLRAALADALAGGDSILPIPPEHLDDPAVQALRESPLPPGTAVVIRTSGSTGVPKNVALSADALSQSAAATHDALGGPGQWLITLPLHLISGLQMLTRGIAAGTTPVIAGGSGLDVDAFFAHADRLTGERRYVSVVPVQLSHLLTRAQQDPAAAAALHRFDAVLVGGAGVSLEMRQRAYELGVQLRRSYGSTETAGGCVYDGVEIGSTLVRIRHGEVQIAGPQLALGYVGASASASAEAFLTETDVDGTSTRWYRTGDAGSLLGGMLEVTGRLDRVIISGGVNVSLDAVERVAQSVPGYSEAVVAGVSDHDWGERVVVLVPAAGRSPSTGPAPANADELRATLREQLGSAAVPILVCTVDAVPRLPGGKVDRAALDRMLPQLTGTLTGDPGNERLPRRDRPRT